MVIYKIFPAVGKVNAITVFNKFFNKQCHSSTSILFIPPTFTMQSKRRSHQRVYADIIFFAPGFFWNVGIVNIGIPCIVSQWILRHKHNPLVSIFYVEPCRKVKAYCSMFFCACSQILEIWMGYWYRHGNSVFIITVPTVYLPRGFCERTLVIVSS